MPYYPKKVNRDILWRFTFSDSKMMLYQIA